tara:strand:+ start:1135 stop:2421 length:1287 start_codon:yes stop_codon:yes gene_type:complete
MNIIQQQELARNSSEKQLISLAEQPNPSIMPPYLVTGELMRRKSIREKMASAPKQTVSEEVLAEAVQSTTPQGIGALTSNMQAPMAAPQEEVMSESITETGIANLPAPNIGQNYARGGIIGYADGGPTPPLDEEVVEDNSAFESLYGTLPVRTPMTMPEELTIQEAINEEAAFLKDAGYNRDIEKDYRATLEEERLALQEKEDDALNFALIKGGLGMMAGTSDNAFTNIAAGATTGVDSYVKDIKDVKKEEKLIKQATLASKRAENDLLRGDITKARGAVKERDNKIIEVAKINLQYNVDVQKALAASGSERGNIYDKAFDNVIQEMKLKYGDNMYNTAFKREPEKMNQILNSLLVDNINFLTQSSKRLLPGDLQLLESGSEKDKIQSKNPQDSFKTGDVSKPKAGSKVNVKGVEYTIQLDGSLKPSD